MYKLIQLQTIRDGRGSLIAIEGEKDIPFAIKRVYYLFHSSENQCRGYHAHKKLKQILICTSGSCKIYLDNGITREEIHLTSPDIGLYIEGLVWREIHDLTETSVLMVLASDYYDEEDYIRDYKEFREVVEQTW